MQLSTLRPFLYAALVWALCVATGAYFLEPTHPVRAVLWALGLWALCIFDLFALAKVVRGALRLAAGQNEAGTADPVELRTALGLNTAFWGLIKLSCLGLFMGVLLKGVEIPTGSLLLGLSTLVVIPLLGGLIWSQRGLKHAW